MSRTDNHRPYWLRAEDAAPVECHDHRFGDCDLPETPSVYHGDWHERPNCYWEANPKAWYGPLGCNCSTCSGHDGYERAKNERKWRKELELEENPRRSPAKKNTKRWCRGKEGREHIPMLMMRRWGLPCGFRPSWKDQSREVWRCTHHEICSTCGKEIRYSIQRGECPEFRKAMGYESNS